MLSRNETTGCTEPNRVSATISRLSPRLVTVTLNDVRTGKVAQTFTSTPDHPFLTAGQGWVAAGGLAVGALVMAQSGPTLAVASVKWRADETRGFAVYNMTVEGDHSYLAGIDGGGTWVHNCPSVNAGDLHVPPDRIDGADHFKLMDQIEEHGTSTEGMPPIEVTEGADGELMINNGVTRATRVHMNDPEAEVEVNIID